MKRIVHITDEERVTVTLVAGLTMGCYQIFDFEKAKWKTKLRLFFVKDIRIPVEEAVQRTYQQRFVQKQIPILRKSLASGQPTPISRAQV